MSVAILPTLNSTTGKLTNQQEITASLVRFVLYNPGETSTSHEDEILSFRKLASTYGHNKEELCEVLRAGFTTMLSRYFPDNEIMADFTYAPYGGVVDEPRYTITFDIRFRNANGEVVPGIESGSFTVDTENRIALNFGNKE